MWPFTFWIAASIMPFRLHSYWLNMIKHDGRWCIPIVTVAFFFVTCLFREYGKVSPKIQKFENSKNWKKTRKFKNSKIQKIEKPRENSKIQKFEKNKKTKKHSKIRKFEKTHWNSKFEISINRNPYHKASSTGHASGRENHRQRTRNESAPIEKCSIHVAKISVQDIQ